MNEDLQSLFLAKNAAAQLAKAAAFAERKNAFLNELASEILSKSNLILAQNAEDVANAKKAGYAAAFVERLTLNESRLEGMSRGIRQVASLGEVVGEVVEEFETKEGLKIRKVRVPLGLVGVIFESRPNVITDAFSICFKASNAVALKGGKECFYTNFAIFKIIQHTLQKCGFDPNCIALLSGQEAVKTMCEASGVIECLIARGGARLIEFVKQNAKVPFLQTGVGNCSVYVQKSADLQMALRVIDNAKTSRPSVCNAAENLLVDEAVAAEFLPLLAQKWAGKVEVIGCEKTARLIKVARVAGEADFDEEFLDFRIAVKVVSGLDEALEFIAKHGTSHSEAIVSQDAAAVERFFAEVDAAALYHNASTRFTDGECFGFGAEIGISTQKLHARGPMALREMTSYKYLICGDGQIRV